MGTLVVSNVCLKVVMNFYDFATVEQNSFFKTVTKKNVVPCVWFIVLLQCMYSVAPFNSRDPLLFICSNLIIHF